MQLDIRAATEGKMMNVMFHYWVCMPFVCNGNACVSGLHEMVSLPNCVYIMYTYNIIPYKIGIYQYMYVVGAKIQCMCCVKTWFLCIMGKVLLYRVRLHLLCIVLN